MPQPPTKGAFLLGLLRDWGIALVVVVAIIAAFNVFLGPRAPAEGPAPDFTLADTEGNTWTLSRIPERVVVLNFWFTNCPPCRREIPELAAWHEANPDVPLLGIHVDPRMPPGAVTQSAKRLGINYPVLDDRTVSITRSYGVDTFPTTIVLVDGAIVDAKVGSLDAATLDAMVSRARER
jgi:thiol-disulfide isomerase/thioredoxin